MPRLACLLLVAALTPACGAPLASAIDEFETGRTTHALRELERLARDGRCCRRDEWPRYALFRGLAHLTLGDARAAERWLMSLKREVQLNPRLLSTPERARLVVALAALGHLPGD